MNHHKIKLLLMISCLCLILTSCRGIKEDVRKDILSCIKESGYIKESDILRYTSKVISDAIPILMAYDYIYDRDGALYNVRIYTSDEETIKYDVSILYDVELDKYSPDPDHAPHVYVSDYGSYIDLIVDLDNHTVDKDWKIHRYRYAQES